MKSESQRKIFLLFYILICTVLFGCNEEQVQVFTLLSKNETGLSFINSITDSDTLNILNYEYIYNGGGVGILDANNDGLKDIYVTGNQVSNALYLNQGNMKFLEVTKESNTALKDIWSSGVIISDVNQDGWDDIFVCASFRNNRALSKNTLLINQGLDDAGIPQFKDETIEYGLDIHALSTHGAFFDYDRDGDLDLFLINNQMVADGLPNKYKKIRTDSLSPRTDLLLKNNYNKETGKVYFENVSRQAGIIYEGFSLGINVLDINEDGWDDVLVTNDYLSNDLLYINQKDGRFVDSASYYFDHTSFSAMGNNSADFNNDGLVDIIALDMLPAGDFRKKTMMNPNNYSFYINNEKYDYDYQFVRNTLQLNLGKIVDGKINDAAYAFQEVGSLAGIAETDWSWTPLVADFDMDGYEDLIITNGFPKDVTDHDFIDYHTENARFASRELLLAQIPEVKLKNYAFKNKGNGEFEDVTKSWGITIPTFSNGAAFSDLDNDGDLDYVVNNIDDPIHLYRNNSNLLDNKEAKVMVTLKGKRGNLKGVGARVICRFLDEGNQKQLMRTQQQSRGYLSSMDDRLFFYIAKTAKNFEIEITWPDGQIQKEGFSKFGDITISYKPNVDFNERRNLNRKGKHKRETLISQEGEIMDPVFMHKEADYIDFNRQPMALHKLSQIGPGIAVSDINSDGLYDFFIPGSKGEQNVFYIQEEQGIFRRKNIMKDTLSYRAESVSALFFDADLDGDEDLYIVNGGNENVESGNLLQDKFYLNDNGNFVLRNQAIPSFSANGSCVRAADFDRDGDLDLFVGSRNETHKYPAPSTSYLLINNTKSGNINFDFAKEKQSALFKKTGLVTDAIWTDFNDDGWIDLIVVGEFMPISIFINKEGELEPYKSTNIDQYKGFWNSIIGADIDKDGDTDYVIGNIGHNNLLGITEETPLKVYGGDFDNNGGYDAIPTVFRYNEKLGKLVETPYFGRGDFRKQINSIQRDFPLYKIYAQAEIQDIIADSVLTGGYVASVNYTSSSLLINHGKNGFELKVLPKETQTSPINGIIAKEVTGDNKLDLLLIGNDFGFETGFGRMDAFKGMVLKGTGDHEFQPIVIQESGFYVPNDAKALVSLPYENDKTLLLASQNRGELLTFSMKNMDQSRFYYPKPMESAVLLTYKGGTKEKVEFYYGNGYLSQSARYLSITKQIDQIKVFSFDGSTKRVLVAEDDAHY